MEQKDYRDRKDAERALVERATSDPDFRAALLADPRRIVSREFDLPDLPEDLSIRVVEETPNEIVIVLPPDLSGKDLTNLKQTANTKWIFF
jgi:hypothetical protein